MSNETAKERWSIAATCRRIGLKALILREGFSEFRTKEIKAFEADITKINIKFIELSKEEMATSLALKCDILALLATHGPQLWPRPDPSKPDDRIWLFKAHCAKAPTYTIDLVYPQHRHRIEPDFINLLIGKCQNYHTNHGPNGPCGRAKASRDHANVRSASQSHRRVLSEASDLTEFTEFTEDDISPSSLIIIFKLPADKLRELATGRITREIDGPDSATLSQSQATHFATHLMRSMTPTSDDARPTRKRVRRSAATAKDNLQAKYSLEQSENLPGEQTWLSQTETPSHGPSPYFQGPSSSSRLSQRSRSGSNKHQNLDAEASRHKRPRSVLSDTDNYAFLSEIRGYPSHTPSNLSQAPNLEQTAPVSPWRQQESIDRTTSQDHDDVMITSVVKVEKPSENWLPTPDHSRPASTSAHQTISKHQSLGLISNPPGTFQASAAIEHTLPHPQVLTLSHGYGLQHGSSARMSQEVTRNVDDSGGQPTELQKRLARTTLLLSDFNAKGRVVEAGAFRHCESAKNVREELAKIVVRSFGEQKLAVVERLRILLFEMKQQDKIVREEKWRYWVTLHESFDEGWDLIEEDLLGLAFTGSERFQLHVDIL